MRLVFEERLSVPPSAAWRYIADPEFMNRWSEARIKHLREGDGPEPWSVGTLRQVCIRAFGRTTVLDEVIQEARPPYSYVYRVVDGAPIRYHRGEISLRDDGHGGSYFRWDVVFRFPLPGMGLPADVLLRHQIGASIQKMKAVCAAGVPETFRPTQPLDESAELPALYAQAEAIYREQHRLAEELTERDDPKRWFVRVYEFVTEEQIRACREGAFSHPAWVLRLIPRFHHYYLQNLKLWEDQRQASCEMHWASSFRAMEKARKWKGGDLGELAYGIAKGMQAHIEEDLPRTLAEIYHWYYRDKCQYGRFRADYLLMSDVFRRASARMLALVPRETLPLANRIYERVVPVEFKDRLQAAFYYDIARERRRTFERGQRLADMLAASSEGTAA